METRTIGKNLIYQRKLKGYTQSVLSEKSDITIRTIQRIEKDEVNPQLHTVKLLADALEIELDQLIILEDPKEESIQKKWLLLIHSSPLIGFIFPFSVLFPLFIWIHKREDNPIYDQHSIKVINFQLSMTILYVLALISLVTIEGWGFFFFMMVFPFNFLVITYNIFKAITDQKCYYPLAFSFLKSDSFMQLKKVVPLFLITYLLSIGCSYPQQNSEFTDLQAYEGKYEYIQGTTLFLKASELDTTLYAIIENAKYPLQYTAKDTFRDSQGSSVIFKRNGDNKVVSYSTDRKSFNQLSTNTPNIEFFPRKALFDNPEGYQYIEPLEINDGLKTGSLLEEFNNPGPIIEMIKQTIKGEYSDVHSVLIYKNNKLVLEEYFYGHDQNTPHQLRSATKSFIGSMVGIAIDQGFIKSEQDPILPYFNSRYKEIANVDQRKEQLTVENMLMYRHGLDCNDNNSVSKGNELTMMQSDDWVKFTLDLPVIQAGGISSSYCTGCALTLGSLVEVATGENIEKFAKDHLFDPMGITNYEWTFEPNLSSSTTFSTMRITSRDLIKLAKMYKDSGQWNGQQIIPENWVKKTFTMDQGDYGYLWLHKYFVIDGKQYNSYMATGNGGQKINIWPELDMITVFTGGNYNSYALYGKSTPPNEMIPKYILKAVE